MPDTTVEEKQVTGSNAFEAARASVAKPVDDTPTETPAEETVTVADQPTAPTEEPIDTLDIPEEEVKKLSLKEQKVYRALQKKFTETSQARSALEKQLDSWKPLIDGFSADPDKTLADLAKERGFVLTKQDQDIARAHTAETVQSLPEELNFLEPILADRDRRLIEAMRAELAPIRETTNQMLTEAAAAETEGTLKAFESKYPEWKKYEPQMLTLAQKFLPAKGAMTDFEYMEHLYKLSTVDISKAEQTKTVIDKINRSASNAEPPASGISSSRVEHTMPADLASDSSSRMRAAWEAAKRGERWTK